MSPGIVAGKARAHLRTGRAALCACGRKQGQGSSLSVGCAGETAPESVGRGPGLTSHSPLLAFLSGWLLGSDCSGVVELWPPALSLCSGLAQGSRLGRCPDPPEGCYQDPEPPGLE